MEPHWDSTSQVGHETCVEYGTDGAENDKRSAGLGADLSSKGITETIQDVVDQQLKDLMRNLDGQSADAVRQAMQARATSLGGSSGNTAQVQEQWTLKPTRHQTLNKSNRTSCSRCSNTTRLNK